MPPMAGMLVKVNIENQNEFIMMEGMLLDSAMTKIIYFISNQNVKYIIIPSSVVEILPYSFSGAKSILEVIASHGSLIKIGYQSFKDCTNLRRIVLPFTLEVIDSEAFMNCNKILCGGVIISENMIEQAKSAGIPERSLSDNCVNNVAFLYRKKTCPNNPKARNILFL